MRWVLLLALGFTLLLSLPQVWGLQFTEMGHGTQVSVVSADAALLSLAPGVGGGNAAETVSYRNSVTRDVLLIDFTKGLNAGTTYGFPPSGLSYQNRFRFRGLFTVTNQSSQTLCLSVYVPGGGVPDLEGIYLRAAGDTGTGTAVAGSGGAPLPCTVSLAPGGTREVDFWWSIGSGAGGVRSFAVRVEGTR